MAIMEAIATTYLEASASSITFSAIPSTYEHLELHGSVRSTRASSTDNVYLTYNGDTGSNYSSHEIAAEGSSSWAGKRTGNAYILMPYNATAATGISSDYSTFTWTILDYAEDGNKNSSGSGFNSGKGAATSPYIVFSSGVWDSTADITSVTLTPNLGDWDRGTEITLYGIKSS